MRLEELEKERSHQMRTRRTFSNEFKAKIVETIASGAASQAELSRQYGISPVMIGRWKKEYSSGKFFENKNNADIASLRIRMAELERLVGELTLENKMLRKAKELNTIQKKDDSPIITSQNAAQLQNGAR
jgi:transposase-like protein